jgi:DNA-3-methyladenine glycosylase
MILDKSFFQRPTLEVAQDLLGKYLVRRLGDKTIALQINEVEAYDGPEDKACHARHGKTKRNEVMFGPGGFWYNYLCYGMYWMLNVVTGPEDYPAAVLFRGACLEQGRKAGAYNGPGKLTRFLELDKEINAQPCSKTSQLWIEDRGDIINLSKIERTPRIGIDYAEEWINKPYRFILPST